MASPLDQIVAAANTVINDAKAYDATLASDIAALQAALTVANSLNPPATQLATDLQSEIGLLQAQRLTP